ncbi:hypothetical protein ACPDI4_001724 [Campylobacter upsaliensis]
MITKDNLKKVLELLNFKPDSRRNTWSKSVNSYHLQVNFANQKLIYPQGIKIHDTTTSNFSHPEILSSLNVCIRLLEKGYKADILVRDNKNAPYLIIECKTAGENSKSEFSKEWERMQNNEGYYHV